MSESPAEETWRIGSIEMAKPRTLELYEMASGIKREELVNKKVLDLGAGKNEQFANDLLDSQINCDVVSLSPDFAFKQYRPEKPRNPVAGIAQYLPFKNDTFDFIFDVGGPGIYANNKEQLKKWVPEAIRVTKKGGKIIIIISKIELVKFMRLNKTLIENGHQATLEELPIEFVREIIIK